MNAWMLLGEKRIVFEEKAPVPALEDGDVLAKVDAALTCGTDLKVYRRGYHARMIVPPSVFGHEFAGEVVCGGNGALPPGTRVVAANSAPCGRCYFCRNDKPNLCEDLLFVNGAYAEYVRIPRRIVEKNLLVIPDNVSSIDAALVEPLACAVKGVHDAGVEAGEQVLIIGAGPLGLMLSRLCVLRGAEVTCVDTRRDRLKVAEELGVEHTVSEAVSADKISSFLDAHSADGRGFDCVIEAVGLPGTWNLAVKLVRPAGRVNLFGGCPKGTVLEVDTNRLHYEEIRILASFHHTPETVRSALDLICQGRIDVSAIVREGRSLADLQDVFDLLASGKVVSKIAVLPQLPSGGVLSRAQLHRLHEAP